MRAWVTTQGNCIPLLLRLSYVYTRFATIILHCLWQWRYVPSWRCLVAWILIILCDTTNFIFVAMVIAYTSHQLHQVCQRSTKSLMRVSREVNYNLMQLNICYAIPTHRGTTGSECRLRAPKQFNPLWQRRGTLLLNKLVSSYDNILTSSESRNGSTTAPSCSDRSLTSAMTCVLLNTRSVCNKPVTVKEHVIDQKADLMFLTETWCKPSKTAVINGLSPSGYSFIGECRSSKRGGGDELLYKSAYKFNNQTIWHIWTFRH